MTPKIIKRSFFIPSLQLILLGILSTVIFSFLSQPVLCLNHGFLSQKKNPPQMLKEIYREVLELGYRQEEQFIKREFFIDLDDNEVNKEEHVVILTRQLGNNEKITIQITYFKPTRKNGLVKQAEQSMEILCSLKEGMIVIEKCDYAQEDIPSLLSKILEGIKSKKKLLQLIRN